MSRAEPGRVQTTKLWPHIFASKFQCKLMSVQRTYEPRLCRHAKTGTPKQLIGVEMKGFMFQICFEVFVVWNCQNASNLKFGRS